MFSSLRRHVECFDVSYYESQREKALEDYECIGTVIVDSSHGARSGPSSSCSNLSRIKSINQKSKDIVFGYIREHDDTEKTATPELVKYLSLLYWYETDEWNIEEMHYMELLGNTIKCFAPNVYHNVLNGFAYLKNEISSGIHQWTFKCHNIGRANHIGIKLKSWNRWDFGGDRIPFDGPESYSVFFLDAREQSGKMELPVMQLSTGYYGICYAIERGATLEMTVNFHDLTLSYKVNSVRGPIDCFKKSIKSGTYVAGIETCSGEHYELLSYHHIY